MNSYAKIRKCIPFGQLEALYKVFSIFDQAQKLHRRKINKMTKFVVAFLLAFALYATFVVAEEESEIHAEDRAGPSGELYLIAYTGHSTNIFTQFSFYRLILNHLITGEISATCWRNTNNEECKKCCKGAGYLTGKVILKKCLCFRVNIGNWEWLFCFQMLPRLDLMNINSVGM